MCNFTPIIDFIGTDERVLYSYKVLFFSLLIYFINEAVLKLNNTDYLKFDRSTSNNLSRFFFWILGAYATALLLIFADLVTKTYPSAAVVSIAWIKLYSELVEKYNTKLPEEI